MPLHTFSGYGTKPASANKILRASPFLSEATQKLIPHNGPIYIKNRSLARRIPLPSLPPSLLPGTVKKSMGGMGMSHRGCHPLHKFPNNVMLKKNQHVSASERGSMGDIGGANRVRNHEPYKMKIHPRKKLPTFFPFSVRFYFVFFPSPLFCLSGQKRRTQKALSG